MALLVLWMPGGSVFKNFFDWWGKNRTDRSFRRLDGCLCWNLVVPKTRERSTYIRFFRSKHFCSFCFLKAKSGISRWLVGPPLPQHAEACRFCPSDACMRLTLPEAQGAAVGAGLFSWVLLLQYHVFFGLREQVGQNVDVCSRARWVMVGMMIFWKLGICGNGSKRNTIGTKGFGSSFPFTKPGVAVYMVWQLQLSFFPKKDPLYVSRACESQRGLQLKFLALVFFLDWPLLRWCNDSGIDAVFFMAPKWLNFWSSNLHYSLQETWSSPYLPEVSYRCSNTSQGSQASQFGPKLLLGILRGKKFAADQPVYGRERFMMWRDCWCCPRPLGFSNKPHVYKR